MGLSWYEHSQRQQPSHRFHSSQVVSHSQFCRQWADYVVLQHDLWVIYGLIDAQPDIAQQQLQMQAPPINQDEMEQLLEWIDGIPFSRPKRNITRDFSDGVFVAEIVRIYRPELIQLHNYPTVSSLSAKYENWKTLNTKVFKKLRFQINTNDINGIVGAVPGCVERVLFLIYSKLKKMEQERMSSDFDSPDGRNVVYSAESKINSQISAQLAEKEETVRELRSTIEILETKMRRMEELNRLKDAKIESLIRKLEEGIN